MAALGPLGGVPRQRRSGDTVARPTIRPARRGCPASAVLLLALVVAQLVLYVAAGAGEPWAGVLAVTALGLALPLVWGLWTGRMCESRLFAVVIAGCVAGAHVLAATVGAPGGVPLGWSGGRVLIVGLALAVAVVVPWRARGLARAAGASAAADPYASEDGTAAAGRGGRRRDRRASAADVGA
ncbi:hypothetical protein G7072_13680 [Nocardioides sp. HDW12B]|uniref:hypothetical protein n=1 Tax=Nocardioides sp. HDW12B TaxID=2714939 RepID=UPI001408DAC6|nr:hypothetical protein [Nocardioides sp. HDW12B]QIK67256.1 hypothetical protein G7072_13680 [Nocardioides sp. HDW12B]